MRLPHPLTSNLGFLAQNPDDLTLLLGSACKEPERKLIFEYFALRLPPVTSLNALSVMFGYNPGFTWSLLHNTTRHYRTFTVPKGRKHRRITAPRVALKLIQKWLSVHFARRWTAPDQVFGFVSGRSHIGAAYCHLGAQWVISADIQNFFPSVSRLRIARSLAEIGYHDHATIGVITSLVCYGHGLAQGSPASPILSNIVLRHLDTKLSQLAHATNTIYTRYADDIVFSGQQGNPTIMLDRICQVIESDGWRISERKKHVQQTPGRLKVHGLLVHGTKLRLTKGYRNRIRAYRHLLGKNRVSSSDIPTFNGHLEYADSVNRFCTDQ